MSARKSRGSMATPTSTTSHKRQLSETAATVTPSSRTSKRLKDSAGKVKSTPTKSKYFEDPDSGDDEVPESADELADSGYEDEDLSAIEEPSGPETGGDDDFDSEEDGRKSRPKARVKKSKIGATSTISTVLEKGKELWRAGVSTGLGPGKQVFIEKPKPRGDGGIKYVPERIHPHTMAFLKDLKNNNDREWLKMHDPDYRESWKDWQSFVEALTEKISEIDETIPELPPKDLVFRIYRDIRFSSDPTPYKRGTGYRLVDGLEDDTDERRSRTGRKGPYACYYVQIQPGGKSRVGAGLWMPEAQPLASLRADIDRKPHRLKRVLMNPQLRKQILRGAPNDEKKVIKAFATQNSENALKTKPKGYDVDNPSIELLRLRNFTLGASIPDEKVVSEQGLQTILDLIGVLVPFVTYLNSVVMPDEDDSSSDGADE
ncbi:hypothetical protein LTR99_000934 [Exophiala xenobiotica]|uniref:Uncharacterized protein n=1 Tax=Vermiconidia calcicola TaxID=1690605 RepID=A0AAV9QP65_9PEZI|nr:hypothetical protein LTR96_003735 [Exophiala xenobiotica]KAK5540722.1 hypothetical protein LTR23_005953 [Chaetothyriales sp. CCFEE 6169]KAK5545497.1 hypothetical protein LTR25_000504 [Vermiconidia calcicola]KAK5307962.1 hypothetical protein LTR99_000934 [Exophiala xenobiotica]KAK5343141.1 hypothetical protein LTR98_000770 [Exophiala xenobiotica]